MIRYNAWFTLENRAKKNRSKEQQLPKHQKWVTKGCMWLGECLFKDTQTSRQRWNDEDMNNNRSGIRHADAVPAPISTWAGLTASSRKRLSSTHSRRHKVLQVANELSDGFLSVRSWGQFVRPSGAGGLRPTRIPMCCYLIVGFAGRCYWRVRYDWDEVPVWHCCTAPSTARCINIR